MNITITTGWWLLPLVMTIASLTWALWDRKDERPDGSMFSGMGLAIGLAMRVPAAGCASLLAWLIWALAA